MGSENIDRLSMLPEEIVTQILSLLPMKLAVQTSILSKTWRYNWMFTGSLNFDAIGDRDTLIKFVDRAFKYCKTSQLTLFRLNFSRRVFRQSTVLNWINEAVKLNVLELDIDVFIVQLPLSLLTCKTLTKLRLCRFYEKFLWECPCPISLPCLKTLDIIVHTHPFANVFKLISGCPMIENLYLELRYWIQEEDDCMFRIPTLKHLKLTLENPSSVSKFVLRVPNLEYLFVCGVFWPSFVMEDVSSLVEVSVPFYKTTYDHLWDKLLKGISGVKSLSIKNKITPRSLIPIFPNMEHLELKRFYCSGQVVRFLQNSPKLKHLHIKEVLCSYWFEPKFPTFMLRNLTTIKFSICQRRKGDIKFLRYMLGNAKVLKRVSIIWDNATVEEEAHLCAQLLKLTRASEFCKILFQGSLSRSTSI